MRRVAYQRQQNGGCVVQLLSKLLVVTNEMTNVDLEIVLLDHQILAELIPADGWQDTMEMRDSFA